MQHKFQTQPGTQQLMLTSLNCQLYLLENPVPFLETPTRETSCQSSIVPDPLPMPVALPDTQLNSSSSSAESLPVSLPSKTSAKLPEQPKKTPRKKVTMDEINELHLAVLQKEKMKLDLEIENILLKKREILLRIQELESRSNLFS